MSLSTCIRTDVITASPNDSVREIAQLMERNNVGSVVITREERPVGIVTDRDLVLRVTAKEKDPKRTLVADVMTRDPIVVSDDAGIFDVVECARDRKIRRIPVVGANNKLVGIIAMDDVVSLLTDEMNCVNDIIRCAGPEVM